MTAPFTGKRSWQAQAELHQHWPSLNLSRVCLVGCLVDVSLSAVSYPLWHLKTREQVLGRNCAQHFRELYATGWRTFYRGGLFGTLALLPGHCIWYLAYEGSKWHLTPLAERTAPAVAAAVAECCWVAVAMPVENVVVRIQCRKASSSALRFGASFQELRVLYQEGGLRRWWNGSLLGLATSLPQSAIWWMVYENCKSFLLPGGNQAAKQSATAGGAAGGAAVLASLATTVLLNPLDVVKSQVQASKSSEAAPVFRQSLSKLFLSGLAPRLMLSAISGLSDSLSYEAIMYLGRST